MSKALREWHHLQHDCAEQTDWKSTSTFPACIFGEWHQKGCTEEKEEPMGQLCAQFDQVATPLQDNCLLPHFELLTTDWRKMTLAGRANGNQNQHENLHLYPSEDNPSTEGPEDLLTPLPTVSPSVERWSQWVELAEWDCSDSCNDPVAKAGLCKGKCFSGSQSQMVLPQFLHENNFNVAIIIATLKFWLRTKYCILSNLYHAQVPPTNKAW